MPENGPHVRGRMIRMKNSLHAEEEITSSSNPRNARGRNRCSLCREAQAQTQTREESFQTVCKSEKAGKEGEVKESKLNEDE